MMSALSFMRRFSSLRVRATACGARRKRRLRSWLLDQRGVSAVEFALIAPIVLGGLLATADVALMVSERMAIDHALRAGAQSAMADPGRDAVLNVMRSTAPEFEAVAVERYCACPGSVGTGVGCSTSCPGSVPPFAYYRLSVEKSFSGTILPQIGSVVSRAPGAFKISSALQVQVR